MSAESIEITPVRQPLRGRIRPPGSKSITNRAFVCAALAHGTSTLSGILDSEDTRVMVEGLQKMGIRVDADFEHATATVHGSAGQLTGNPGETIDIYLANSGTSMRFLTAAACLTRHGTYRLHGTKRMHERPIEDLIDALRQLGANVATEKNNGCPPVIVRPAQNGLGGGQVTMRGDVSSQFLSALMMVAPYATSDVDIRIEGPLVSVPYVTMTSAVMQAFGVTIESNHSGGSSAATTQPWRFQLPAGRHYQGKRYEVEPDASAASYFWAAAAITGGDVLVEGLTQKSLQGDVQFVRVMQQMGCTVEATDDGIRVRRDTARPLTGTTTDMNAISDTAQTLAAVALFAEGPTTIRGIAHVRHKETDRIAALATELRKFGATVHEHDDGLTIIPPPPEQGLHGAEIATYDDHRMAMSMALVGLKVPGVRILDPGCTAKTYPRYFDDLRRLCRQGT